MAVAAQGSAGATPPLPRRVSHDHHIGIEENEEKMLVLTRKVNEAIVIAGEIRVSVAEFLKGKVRLGIEAPRYVTVDREEIHLLKQRPARGPPEVFTQQEYDLLANPTDCEQATFCGRKMYVREGRSLPSS